MLDFARKHLDDSLDHDEQAQKDHKHKYCQFKVFPIFRDFSSLSLADPRTAAYVIIALGSFRVISRTTVHAFLGLVMFLVVRLHTFRLGIVRPITVRAFILKIFIFVTFFDHLDILLVFLVLFGLLQFRVCVLGVAAFEMNGHWEEVDKKETDNSSIYLY